MSNRTLKAIRSILSWISNRPKGHDWLQITMRTNLFLDGTDGVVVSPIYQCLKCKVTIASDGKDNIKCEPWITPGGMQLASAWHNSEDLEIRSCEEECSILAMDEALE